MVLIDKIKEKAHSLGFSLAGVTTADPPPHLPVFQNWLALGRNGSMDYLSDPRRVDPRLVMSECRSILVLGIPYPFQEKNNKLIQQGGVAAYARGDDYHSILPEKLEAIARFIEQETKVPVAHRNYTDTGPLLERDLAQRAGLGWIGKNTCLINPEIGSSFFLAEILLGIKLEPDEPFTADRCGTCTRCIDACPTRCILPDRTLDARRCISYLTIENKGDIPLGLRPQMGGWIFGCDVCQLVCPWNKDEKTIDNSCFRPRPDIPPSDLSRELSLTSQEFNKKFMNNPIRRARRSGYLRNVSVALGNQKDRASIPALEKVAKEKDDLISLHAKWALGKIRDEGNFSFTG